MTQVCLERIASSYGLLGRIYEKPLPVWISFLPGNRVIALPLFKWALVLCRALYLQLFHLLSCPLCVQSVCMRWENPYCWQLSLVLQHSASFRLAFICLRFVSWAWTYLLGVLQGACLPQVDTEVCPTGSVYTQHTSKYFFIGLRDSCPIFAFVYVVVLGGGVWHRAWFTRVVGVAAVRAVIDVNAHAVGSPRCLVLRVKYAGWAALGGCGGGGGSYILR